MHGAAPLGERPALLREPLTCESRSTALKYVQGIRCTCSPRPSGGGGRPHAGWNTAASAAKKLKSNMYGHCTTALAAAYWKATVPSAVME